MTYRFYTFGVVASLNKMIGEEFGYKVLSEPYERRRITSHYKNFAIPIATERFWREGSSAPDEMAPFEEDHVFLQEFVWVHPDDAKRPWLEPRWYQIRIGVAEKAKQLIWSTVDEETHDRS